MSCSTPTDDRRSQRPLDELIDVVASRNAQPHNHDSQGGPEHQTVGPPASLEAPARGLTISIDNDETMLAAVEAAFRYRGDVDIALADGTVHRGYVFDRRTVEPPGESTARLIQPHAGTSRITIRYADIRQITFSGRDAAAGKGWEHWLKKHGLAKPEAPDT